MRHGTRAVLHGDAVQRPLQKLHGFGAIQGAPKTAHLRFDGPDTNLRLRCNGFFIRARVKLWASQKIRPGLEVFQLCGPDAFPLLRSHQTTQVRDEMRRARLLNVLSIMLWT